MVLVLEQFNHLSSWRTLINVIARIKRLASSQKYLNNIVTVEEQEKASEVVIKLVQQQAFSQEIRAIQGGKVLQKSSALFHLNLIWKSGLF